MADIRVTCPACKTQLEIGAEYEGQEVECGTCLEVFVASTKKPKPKTNDGDPFEGFPSSGGKVKGTPSRSRASRDRDDDDDDYEHDKKRRRDDDDDDDYDPRPSRRSGESNGVAVASLILGILSILCMLGSCIPTVLACCCGLGTFGFSIGAIVTGAIGMKKQEGKGMATAGLVMGILSLVGIVTLLVIGFAIGLGGNAGQFR